ncbi:carbon-nitrogen hydrolase family protein [Antribacter gilvus]|uniref:carbon-nitrogen hydrolase family protein n=1 Tax=Antribacter gilvus TaxID=2304675 RepID=UPI000F78DBE6|nr:carbon-nitrogen hydrolase family protein [Antribacter gilvus]
MIPEDRLTVAAVQSVPVRDIRTNVADAALAAREAADAGARLVLFPELSLTGYDLSDLDRPDAWFTPGDLRLEPVRDVAAASGATVVVGAPVEHGGARYIAALAVTGTQPDVVAAKTHLHGAEVGVVVPGRGPVVVEVAGWRVALAVCFDTAFPAHAASARDAGADVYAASVLYTEGEERTLDVRLAARAIDHRLYTVAANLGGHPLGRRSAGGSGVWSPDGASVATARSRDGETVLATLDPARVRASLPFAP